MKFVNAYQLTNKACRCGVIVAFSARNRAQTKLQKVDDKN